MKFRIRPWLLAAGPLLALAGCDYSDSSSSSIPAGLSPAGNGPASESTGSGPSNLSLPADPGASLDDEKERKRGAILASSLSLIETASSKPGGDNFQIATDNLNHYFVAVPASEYAMNSASRAYLRERLPEEAVLDMERRPWILRDARHIEDCMLYHTVATRVAGTGDDLTRVRRVFDWTVRQITLVPQQTLSAPGVPQVPARPFDVLLRGMATEAGGNWSERGWLFMSLCRQLGIDVGIVTYTPTGAKEAELGTKGTETGAKGPEPAVWICAALIDKKLYLFDARIGLEVPGPTGAGVATLDDALNHDIVLGRLDLPAPSPYDTTRDLLRKSPSKIGILIDSGPGYFSPRMLLLQEKLVGRNRTILHRDPADQRDRFAEALGAHAGKVALWGLPMMVETRLFTDPQFVRSTQLALMLFQPRLPLVYARLKQLKGETNEAILDYVNFRFAESSTEVDKKTPLPREVQDALDIYATYFLGLCHLERNDAKQAAFFFEKTLALVPEPGPGRPYYYMLRWGALANLGRLKESEGDSSAAIAYDTEPNPTIQYHGNLVRARDLLWQDPTAPPHAPLAAAPVMPSVPAGIMKP